MPTVFIPKEVTSGETRVAATPETVKRMVKDGFRVLVESGAGTGSFISDEAFRETGARVDGDPAALYAEADVVLKLHPPQFLEERGVFEADLIKEGSILISFLFPLFNLGTVKALG